MLPALLLLIAFDFLLVSARPSSDLTKNHVSRDAASSAELAPTAAKDPASLTFSIVGIVGAYAVWLVITILLIVFVGKRLRRRAQTSNATLQMVMMKPRSKPAAIDSQKSAMPGILSPKSPGRLSNLKAWGKKGHKNNASEYSISTVASYDEAHRARNMDELSQLYAAVMAHDERKEAASSVTHVQSPPLPPLPQATNGPYHAISSHAITSPQYPPEFQHLHSQNHLSNPMAPTPLNDHFLEDDYHEQSSSRNTYRSNKSTPLSMISEFSSRAGEMVSPRKPRHITIRNQSISQPMGSAGLRDADLYGESVPLSPRIYNPGPAPPTPGSRKHPQIQNSSRPSDQARYYEEEEEEPQVEQIQVHMQPTKERRVPPSLALRSAAYSNSSLAAGAQTSLPSKAPKALPFREVYGDSSLRSAPPTKTTFLERPSKSSGAPRTGVVPQTPYSPYMPFTPMTPITPSRLATRQEIKKNRKQERLKVLTEDDLVTEDDDMWGKVR